MITRYEAIALTLLSKLSYTKAKILVSKFNYKFIDKNVYYILRKLVEGKKLTEYQKNYLKSLSDKRKEEIKKILKSIKSIVKIYKALNKIKGGKKEEEEEEVEEKKELGIYYLRITLRASYEHKNPSKAISITCNLFYNILSCDYPYLKKLMGEYILPEFEKIIRKYFFELEVEGGITILEKVKDTIEENDKNEFLDIEVYDSYGRDVWYIEDEMRVVAENVEDELNKNTKKWEVIANE